MIVKSHVCTCWNPSVHFNFYLCACQFNCITHNLYCPSPFSLLFLLLRWNSPLIGLYIVILQLQADNSFQSENRQVFLRLFNFLNVNASSVRTIKIAKCQAEPEEGAEGSPCVKKSKMGADSLRSGKIPENCPRMTRAPVSSESDHHHYHHHYHHHPSSRVSSQSPSRSLCPHAAPARNDCLHEHDRQPSSRGRSKEDDRYLIFTTGTKCCSPHQIGIRRINYEDVAWFTENIRSEGGLVQGEESSGVQDGLLPTHAPPGLPNDHEHDGQQPDAFDKVDHLIELHGHIIGMGLSPDDRSVPWNLLILASWKSAHAMTQGPFILSPFPTFTYTFLKGFLKYLRLFPSPWS